MLLKMIIKKILGSIALYIFYGANFFLDVKNNMQYIGAYFIITTMTVLEVI